MVSHIPINNPKPINNIAPILVTTKFVTFMMSSWAGQFYNDLVDSRYMGHRKRITRVASVQATTMGKTMPFCPCWEFIWHVCDAIIVGPATKDVELSSSKQLWLLPSGEIDKGTLNQIMLRTIISEFGKNFPGKTDWIPLPENVKSMMNDQIEAALRFWAPMLTWPKLCLCNTLTVKDNWETVILWE